MKIDLLAISWAYLMGKVYRYVCNAAEIASDIIFSCRNRSDLSLSVDVANM